MPIATVTTVYCVQQASGADVGALQALTRLPAALLAAELGGDLLQAITSLPDVVAAVDTARSDPDDLYLTTDTVGDVDAAVWPAPGVTKSMQAGQSAEVMLALEFGHSLNVSLWDHDSVSDDDLLGSVTILTSDTGQGEVARLASSRVEGSVYYVLFTVE